MCDYHPQLLPQGVIIPFLDTECRNISAAPSTLNSTACSPTAPELLTTGVAGVRLECGIPLITPPPSPSGAWVYCLALVSSTAFASPTLVCLNPTLSW